MSYDAVIDTPSFGFQSDIGENIMDCMSSVRYRTATVIAIKFYSDTGKTTYQIGHVVLLSKFEPGRKQQETLETSRISAAAGIQSTAGMSSKARSTAKSETTVTSREPAATEKPSLAWDVRNSRERQQ